MQNRDEPIRSYLARFKGISAVCKLTLQCSYIEAKKSGNKAGAYLDNGEAVLSQMNDVVSNG